MGRRGLRLELSIPLPAIGRPKVDPQIENAIRASLSRGVGILKTARELPVGSETVQRVKATMGSRS